MQTRRRGASRTFSIGFVFAVVVVALFAYVFLYPGGSASKSPSSTSSAASISTSDSSSFSSTSPLITFNADAYTAEVQALLRGFTSTTGIPTAPTHSAGSFALAKQIASGSRVDVFIPVALSAAAPSNLGNFSSNWAIGFASDQMVLAYSNATLSSSATSTVVSQFQQAFKSNASSDWSAAFASLASGKVQVGISDPDADPAGLRGWLVLEAAGLYYGGNQSEYTSTLLAARANVTGSAAANMVAPLQAGQFQFLFIYRSAAIAQHLGYLQLDHLVNLGSAGLAASYAKFTYELRNGVNKGAPIVLCVTVPVNPPSRAEAMEFVRYVVMSSGPAVSPFGLQPLSPPLLYVNGTPPQFVSDMFSQGQLAVGGVLGP